MRKNNDRRNPTTLIVRDSREERIAGLGLGPTKNSRAISHFVDEIKQKVMLHLAAGSEACSSTKNGQNCIKSRVTKSHEPAMSSDAKPSVEP